MVERISIRGQKIVRAVSIQIWQSDIFGNLLSMHFYALLTDIK